MIETWKDKDTHKIWRKRFIKTFSKELQIQTYKKLVILNNTRSLDDLKEPPGNQLEVLLGDRKGTYSIRVNDQWRICFRWSEESSFDVELVDYHK